MPTTGLSTFALVALGLLIGVLLATLLVAVAAITYTLFLQRRDTRSALARVARTLELNTTAISLLRTEVVTSLTRMDADRMHDASIGIQRASKNLNETVNALWKLVYRVTASNDINSDVDTDFGYGPSSSPSPLPPGLDEEALADASKIAQDRNSSSNFSFNSPSSSNPLDILTPAEREARIHEFFSARRMRTDGGGFANAHEALAAQAAQMVAEGSHPPHANLPDFSPDDDLSDDSLGVSD